MSYLNRNAKSFHKDQVLDWFMYHLPMETRFKLMQDLPAAYNDLVGQDVAIVLRKTDLPDGVTFDNAQDTCHPTKRVG